MHHQADEEAVSTYEDDRRTQEIVPAQVSNITPPDPASLAQEVATRLRSTGGRPTDPGWTLSRQIPFAPSTWDAVQRLSMDISARGRKVGPGAVAAMLIEGGIDQLDQVIREKAAQQSDSGRRPPL